MTMNRIFAILYTTEKLKDNVKKTYDLLKKLNEKVYIFSYNKLPEYDSDVIILDKNVYDTIPKFRNYVNKYFKDQKFSGYLHVINDSTDIINNPSVFINNIEKTIDVLDYDVWFSTVTDECNYVYSKYNPRLAVALDKQEYKKLDLPENFVFFTSNSNTQWVIYNYAKITDDLLRFDEDFTVDMFYIIEFLARRNLDRRTQTQLYYMNWYMSIPSEYGVFKTITLDNVDKNMNSMEKEDKIFKAKNVNLATINIDRLLSVLNELLSEKLKITDFQKN